MLPPEPSRYAFGPFQVDVADQLLLRDGEPVPLTPKAFATLLALIERQGRVVSKEELLQAVWPDTYVAEATLTQNIYTLRKALAADEGGKPVIETLPRRGYRFRASVRRLESPAPIPASGRSSAAASGESPLDSARTLAVLPLRVLGPEGDDELIGIGLADALITRLSNLRALVVRPTSAVLRYAREEYDPALAGRRLGVEAVLEGTVQSRGERSRVNVQLVSVSGGAPLWAQQFDATSTDPFELQDSISEQAVHALRLVPSHEEQSRLSRRPTSNPEAYQAYVRGRFFWNKRTEADLEKAIRYFRLAAEHDPDSARAHAGLADAHALLPLFGSVPPAECFPEAIRAAGRALLLDDGLAEAHTSLAYSRWLFEWDWEASEAGFERALELNPSYPNAHHWYSFLLAAAGRRQEAIRSARRAQELDPLSLVINTDLGLVLYFAHRFEEAVSQHRHTLELDPDFAYCHFALSLALTACGRAEDGIAAARRAVELSRRENTAMLAALGYVLARADRRREAEEILADLCDREATGYVPASRFAMVQAALGDTEGALDRLQQACDQRSRFVIFVGVWPVFDAIRAEPRFTRLLERVGLGTSLDNDGSPARTL